LPFTLLKKENPERGMNLFQNAMVKVRECQLGIPKPGSLKRQETNNIIRRADAKQASGRHFRKVGLEAVAAAVGLPKSSLQNVFKLCRRSQRSSTPMRGLWAVERASAFPHSSALDVIS
jgi:hypothetical protein